MACSRRLHPDQFSYLTAPVRMPCFLLCDVPSPSGEGQGEGRLAQVIRSCCACLLTLLVAGSAAAQPTPETPGSAGAEAGVRALVEAQRAQDWPTVVALMDPTVVLYTADYTRGFARGLHAVLADSAAVVQSDRFGAEFDSDMHIFAMARRLDAVLPSAETLGDADLLVRVLRASQARRMSFFAVYTAPPAYRAIGTVTEGDSLAYVVGRTTWTGFDGNMDERVETVPMLWSGTRWTLAGSPASTDGVLRDVSRVFGNWIEVVGGIVEDGGGLLDVMEDSDGDDQ